jgi:hypothetical protein
MCLYSRLDHFEMVFSTAYSPLPSTKHKTHHPARVELFNRNKFVLIYHDEGHSETPNSVTFTDQGPITGLKAKEEADSNPENTIYDFRYVHVLFRV